MYHFTPNKIDRDRAHDKARKQDADDIGAKRIGDLEKIAFEQFCRGYLLSDSRRPREGHRHSFSGDYLSRDSTLSRPVAFHEADNGSVAVVEVEIYFDESITRTAPPFQVEQSNSPDGGGGRNRIICPPKSESQNKSENRRQSR